MRELRDIDVEEISFVDVPANKVKFKIVKRGDSFDKNQDDSQKNLEKEVPAGSQIIITYPLLAKNPKPEVKYGTPVEIKVNVPVKGKEFIKTDLDEPEFKIKYVKIKKSGLLFDRQF